MITRAGELLDVKEDELISFSTTDSFNNDNLLEGFICRKSDHRYGALVIFKINDAETEQIIWATPKLHYPFDKAGVYQWPNVYQSEFYEKLDGCLNENIQLETEDGIKTIKDICENKYNGKIKSFDIFNNEIFYDNIIDYSIQENINNWYEIELENGHKLLLTGNHKIWIPSLMCYRSVTDLTGDEEILIDI